MYWGLFEMNCWAERSDQIAKGGFSEVPYKLSRSSIQASSTLLITGMQTFLP